MPFDATNFPELEIPLKQGGPVTPVVPQPDEATLVLIRARSLIVQKGWLRNIMHVPFVGYCATGAILGSGRAPIWWRRFYPTDAQRTAMDRLMRQRRGNWDGYSIAGWNDKVSKGVVLEAFDQAIIKGNHLQFGL